MDPGYFLCGLQRAGVQDITLKALRQGQTLGPRAGEMKTAISPQSQLPSPPTLGAWILALSPEINF